MYYLGIDLGGTNIASGVVDENFNIIGRGKVKTNCPRPVDEIVDDIALSAKLAIENAGITIDEIESMGIGSPGAINPVKGMVVDAGNLNFHLVPLCDMLKERLGVDFYIENDANAAAYGEYIAGAGKGTNNFIAITLGTGVGGGIIIDKKIYSGSNYAGAEIGHMVISVDGEPCTCGRNGCFEAYASATALIRQTKEAMEKNQNSIMWEIVDNNINDVNGRTAFDAMRKNDVAGKAVVDRYLYYVASGITSIINIFQPDLLCIGGGISKEGEVISAPIREIVASEILAKNTETKTKIRTAELGNDAGIIGAAMLYKLYK